MSKRIAACENLSFNLILRSCDIAEISRFGHLSLSSLCIHLSLGR